MSDPRIGEKIPHGRQYLRGLTGHNRLWAPKGLGCREGSEPQNSTCRQRGKPAF
jgi:hypothetical protein